MQRLCLNLKMERVWQKDYTNHSEAMTDVADYIAGFYNCTRLHSTLGIVSPNAFERESAKQQSIDVSEKNWPPHCSECETAHPIKNPKAKVGIKITFRFR